MSMKARLNALERHTQKKDFRIGVHIVGDPYIFSDGQAYTPEEWNALWPDGQHIHVSLNLDDQPEK